MVFHIYRQKHHPESKKKQKKILKRIKSTSRQEKNETLINKIKEYQINLSTKLEKDEKYLNQFKSINILLNYLKKTIKEVTNDYYDSDEFKVFKSFVTSFKYTMKASS